MTRCRLLTPLGLPVSHLLAVAHLPITSLLYHSSRLTLHAPVLTYRLLTLYRMPAVPRAALPLSPLHQLHPLSLLAQQRLTCRLALRMPRCRLLTPLGLPVSHLLAVAHLPTTSL